jgi:hypothetical protein
VFKKFLLRPILPAFICLTLLVSATAKTQSTPNNFDDTLAKWFAHINFKVDVLDYQKIYDDNGYIDYFRMQLQEKPVKNSEERNPAKIFLELTDNEGYQFAQVKVTEKDIHMLPFMKADWIARYAISYAIKKVSKLAGLQSHTEKVGDGIYRVTVEPAPTSVASRYRFTQLEIFYQVKDLFLSLDVTVKSVKNYLILTYYVNELNGILRALENGNFPGATSETLISELVKGSPDDLLHDLLRVPESLHGKLLELERNPGATIEELNPED